MEYLYRKKVQEREAPIHYVFREDDTTTYNILLGEHKQHTSQD